MHKELVELDTVELFSEFLKRLDKRFGGDYTERFQKIKEERKSPVVDSHRILTTAVGLQLLVETLDTRESPELHEARIIAGEVLRIVSRQDSHSSEDMRELIGRELDLSDTAILEAWETIERNRIGKEG
jgi:hypothetical protein